jgi:phosphatidylinositol alpha-1,6-mannosyltransferase
VLGQFPDARLLLIGDGPDRWRIERLVARHGVAASVILTGSVPWSEVPAYTDAGDVFAMPCRTRLFGLEPEAFGIVFLEAQACGTRVLVGRSGGAPEVLIDQSHGSVVAPAVDDVVKALLQLLETPRWRALTTTSSKAAPSKIYSWDAASKRLRVLLVATS